jgi:molybdopterin synthase catalytic subunit
VRIRTLFFAAYRDLVGLSHLDVEVPEGSTVAQLVAAVRGRGAPFAQLPVAPAVAVNLSYSLHDVQLAAGDEVAFIPPVAGG